MEWDKNHEIKSVLVNDRQAVSACVDFANHHRYLTEPACGASLAVVYEQHKVLENAKSVVIIVCGGIGVDINKLKEWRKIL